MSYIGQAPSTIVSENTFDEFNFTATSNQTTFTGVDADGKTLVYNPGNLEVFLNGVRLEEADFTATNGTSVVLSTGATTGDVMSVKSFTVFEVSDTVSKASGGAFGGNISVTGTVTATSYSGDGSSLSGISTDLVGDITPQLGGNLDTNGKNIAFGDSSGSTNNRLTFGSNNEFQIYQNPSLGTYMVENGSGKSMRFMASDFKLQNTAGSHEYIVMTDGGSVAISHGNGKKFETTTTGVTITGDINSTGDVGIGTTNPATYSNYKYLHVHATTNSYLKLTNNTTGTGINDGFDVVATGSDAYLINRENGIMGFSNNGSDRMIIDSSGNVLVNTTVVTLSDATSGSGIALQADGQLEIARSGTGTSDVCARFNRSTGDGPIVEFRKSGSTKGNIGTNSYSEYNISSEANLTFTQKNSTERSINFGTDHFGPFIGDGDAVDLGRSNSKFKDLYLSNRVKLGASGGIEFGHATSTVGSASSTLLDHYEEGTWTPILTGYSGGTTQTYAVQSGFYIRIGRQVIANFSVRLSSKGNISGNYVHIKGLPYNHQGSYAGSCTFNYVVSLNNARDNLMMEMGGSTPDRGWITYMDGTSTSYMNTSDINNGTGFQGTIVYYTS